MTAPAFAWIADWIEDHRADTGHFVSAGAAADIAKQVRQRLTEGPTGPWVSVKDRLPEPGGTGERDIGEFIVAYPAKWRPSGFNVTVARGRWFDDHLVWSGVPPPTHWMPLPEPPQ